MTLQSLGPKNLIVFGLLGEDISVPSYVVEFDFNYCFLAVAAVD
jgi:hypothetical protein